MNPRSAGNATRRMGADIMRHRTTVFDPTRTWTLLTGRGGHCVEASRLGLQVGPLPRAGADQESRRGDPAARARGKVASVKRSDSTARRPNQSRSRPVWSVRSERRGRRSTVAVYRVAIASWCHRDADDTFRLGSPTACGTEQGTARHGRSLRNTG
jgi:hypothetical protein